jgi:hypothetical protein
MSLVLFAAAGLVDDYLLLCGFVLIHTTMHYGFFAEELCRPMYDPDTGKPSMWLKTGDNKDMLFFDWLPCMAPFERLVPHLMGYIPYGTIWFIFLHQFLSNASDSETGQSAPWFVWLILIGQLSVFSCFGFIQMFNLAHYWGPSWFVSGELTYILLSFVAKGLLGMTLIFSVFQFQRFEDAVVES